MQRPHFPIPHFIRSSSVVYTCSSEKPISFKPASTNLIMIGGPQRSAVLSVEKPISFQIGRNETDMTVPAFLFPVDSQIDIDARSFLPDFLDLF